MTQPRDCRGWRVPRSGTRSRLVYDLMVLGLSARQICARLGGSLNSVAVLAHDLRNPDQQNLNNRRWLESAAGRDHRARTRERRRSYAARWRAANREAVKVAVTLGVSVEEARALLGLRTPSW